MPVASFVPDEDPGNYTRRANYITSLGGGSVFYAPIVLPDGATLKRIVIYYTDNNSMGSVFANVYKVKLATSADTSIGGVSSDAEGASSEVQKMKIYLNQLINEYNTYTLKVGLDSNCSIHGIRVEYTMP